MKTIRDGFFQIFSYEFNSQKGFFSFKSKESLMISESLIILDIFLKNNVNFLSLFVESEETQNIVALILEDLFKSEDLIENYDKNMKLNLILKIMNKLS